MVVETSRFKVKEGISDEEVLSASREAYDGFLSKCKGFASRELLKTDDGTWLDIVRFDTLDDAQQAMKNFLGHQSTKKFENIIDPQSVNMQHYEVIEQYQ